LFSLVIVVAAAAGGEDPRGMHPNQMPGNLKKRKNINPSTAYLMPSQFYNMNFVS